jgi:hypothetical protein
LKRARAAQAALALFLCADGGVGAVSIFAKQKAKGMKERMFLKSS